MAEDFALIAKAMAGGLALAVSSALPGINHVTLPFVAVPLTALTMSAAGAVCSFAWQSGETSRGKLFAVVTGSALVGATFVGIVPLLFGMEVKPEFQPPLSFLCGLAAPWVIPAARAALPSFFSALANMLVKMVGGKVQAIANDDPEPKVYKPKHKATEDGED